jgi:hypothetical protein
MPEKEMELGLQPLDAVMTRLGLVNSALVEATTEQLTHKMVQKGRNGRRLTPHIRSKILKALNSASAEEKFILRDLFNY